MTDSFIGEIRAVGFNFAPVNWALCQGQLLPIAQNTALFSILGTYYGGDGVSNFALPNLQGAAALAAGQGVGLSNYDIGEAGGTASVTLLSSQLPSHSHPAVAAAATGTQATPAGALLAEPRAGRGTTPAYAPASAASAALAPAAVGITGGATAHSNLQPYLALNYIICLSGIFPPRS